MNAQSFFPVSKMNGYFKNIFWVKLDYLEELCVAGHLNNECIVSSSVSLINSHFRIIFWVELFNPKELCIPGNLYNEHSDFLI